MSQNTNLQLDFQPESKNKDDPIAAYELSLSHDKDRLKPEMRSIVSGSYEHALKTVGLVATTLIGANFALMSPLGRKFVPKYSQINIDNKLYGLAIICLICTQWRVKDYEMVGLTSHNVNRLDQNSREELAAVLEFEKRQEEKKAALLKQQNINTPADFQSIPKQLQLQQPPPQQQPISKNDV
eukprot:UN01414